MMRDTNRNAMDPVIMIKLRKEMFGSISSMEKRHVFEFNSPPISQNEL